MSEASCPRSWDAEGFVLAGGRSSRMGVDKALVKLGGDPLIVHALRALLEAGLEASIAGARSDLAMYAPVVADGLQDLGPLSGICSALSSTARRRAMFVPVDLPLMASGLLRFLLIHAETTGALVTLASVNGFPQTFPAVIRRDALPALRHELDSRRLGCFHAFQSASEQVGESMSILPIEVLVQCGQIDLGFCYPASRCFQNINTPGDLDHVSSLLEHAVA